MPASAFACLLRGINVSGHKMIKMDRLRASFEALELEGVQTYVQSGNVVFHATAKKPDTLAAVIHQKILEDFAFEVPVTVLTAKDLAVTLHDNPFLKEKGIDPATLHVTFLSAKPAAAALEKLQTVAAGPDRFHSVGKLIYSTAPKAMAARSSPTRSSSEFCR